MTPLVAKEIRLLLPAYVLALALAGLPLLVCLVPSYASPMGSLDDWSSLLGPVFAFGAGLLGLTSFGREFGLNTFALVLAQPLERRRIWRAKVGVLAAAMASLAAVWSLASVPAIHQDFEWPAWRRAVLAASTCAAVAFAGGLWTTLLLRQVVSAFWFSLLVPALIVVAVASLGGSDTAAFIALALYAAGGVVLAWWQFRHVQETMWTGGVVSFAGWRGSRAVSGPSLRVWRPVAALVWKELQLQQVSLVAMAWLLVLHLGVIMLRKSGHYANDSGIRTGLEVFGGLWLLVPLLVGGPSVAEERKLGVTSAQLCLPFSDRIQFAIKLGVVLLLGGLLSAFLLWAVESLGTAIGAAGDIGGLKIHPTMPGLAVLSLAFLALAVIGFYASTLARHFVQALALALPTLFVVWGLAMTCPRPFAPFGVFLWQGYLLWYVAAPILLIVFLWLSYRNFKRAADIGRLWFRNLLAWAGTVAFIFLVTVGLYHRAWELLLPLEPAPGPARLAGPAGGRPVLMSSNGGNALAALLPDGRLWVDCIWYDSGRRILCFGELPGFQLGTKWLSLSGNQILPGSNWVAVVANFRNTVAVRSDGTLWVPETPRQGYSDQGEPAGPPPIEPGAPLVRFGEETNWQVVVHDITYESFAAVLLKTDGTLWRWSPNRPVARNAFNGLRSFEPHRLGSDSDWARLQAVGAVVYCWKRDGQAWALHRPPHIPGQNQAVPEPPVDVVTVITRVPGLDNFNFRSVAHLGGLHVAVRDDGTLWSWDIRPPKGPWDGLNFSPRPPVQLGHETDWSSVAGEWRSLSALKTDGSLWQWQFSDVWAADTKLGRRAPVRLGRHNDWVALSDVFGNTVSLAADGSLWYWWYRSPGVAESDQPLLAPSRRPSRLENILAAGGSM